MPITGNEDGPSLRSRRNNINFRFGGLNMGPETRRILPAFDQWWSNNIRYNIHFQGWRLVSLEFNHSNFFSSNYWLTVSGSMTNWYIQISCQKASGPLSIRFIKRYSILLSLSGNLFFDCWVAFGLVKRCLVEFLIVDMLSTVKIFTMDPRCFDPPKSGYGAACNIRKHLWVIKCGINRRP